MDHSHHDHSAMDMDMSSMAGGRCSMYMLWNTNIIDTCVVFRQWHIRSNLQFILTFFAIVALGVSYEWLRDYQRRVDRRIAARLLASGKGKNAVSQNQTSRGAIALEEEEELNLSNTSTLKADQSPIPFGSRLLRASLYGASVFLSFFLMLVFMTYNGYLILATVTGAAIGHFIYGGRMDPDAVLGGEASSKGMSCH